MLGLRGEGSGGSSLFILEYLQFDAGGSECYFLRIGYTIFAGGGVCIIGFSVVSVNDEKYDIVILRAWASVIRINLSGVRLDICESVCVLVWKRVLQRDLC